MKIRNILWVGMLSVIAVTAIAAPVNELSLSFDAAETLPPGWKADATHGKPAEWKVARDSHAQSSPNTLSIARFNDMSGSTFNLFWSPTTLFHNGVIEVNIRANSGDIDQGGGLIWRAQDANNYYIARYNPLEKNLRLYYVKDGVRQMLADSPRQNVGSDEWFTLKVAHRNTQIEAWLNGKKLIEKTDAIFTNAGGVGFWTKADANSAFDNIKVHPEN